MFTTSTTFQWEINNKNFFEAEIEEVARLRKKQLCRENTINGGIGCPFDDQGTRVDKTHCLLDDQR